mgnify:FL=1
MAIKIKKLHKKFGAEILNYKLSKDLNNKSFKEILKTFNEYGILLFRNQNLSIKNQVTFGRKFGKVLIHAVNQNHAKGHPEIYILSNLDSSGKPSGKHPDQGSLYWHTDGSWRKKTGQATIMVADIIPSKGGETHFCCMENAYDFLDDSNKQKIINLFAYHNLDFSRNRRHGHDPLSKKQKNNAPPVIHPVVRTHPSTKRKSLFLGDHAEYIEGMDYSKGRNFIEKLNKLATKTQFIYKHKYKEGDVLVWDNRRLLHKGTKYDTTKEKRVMRRTTIIGEVPK